MPKLTPQNDRVLIYGLLNPDDKEFDIVQQLKIMQMVQEIRISEDYCRSDIIVTDMGYYSLAHILKIGVPYVKKYELCSLVRSLVIINMSNRPSNIVI
jgi:heptaprenylglyceryl phosphate synthase